MSVYRITPNGKNRTPELVQILLQAGEGTEIIFEQGVYDFYEVGCHRGYYFPGCNRNGEKNVIFPLLWRKKITIEGNGSLFLFHDRVFPFIVQGCEEVILRNFKIDFSFPRCVEAMVESADENGLSLAIDSQKYCYWVNDAKNLIIKAGNEAISSSERRFFLEQKTHHCFLSIGEIFYSTTNSPAEVVCCNAKKTKNGIHFQYCEGTEKQKFQAGKKILLNCDELRENDVIFLEKSKNILVEDVHILHGAGMGIVGQCCENLTIKRVRVSPEAGDLYSTTADGVLLTNIKGKVTMQDCMIEHSVDDAISIHGFYTRVEQITDWNKAIVRLMHPSQAGTNLYFGGDVLQIIDAKTMKNKGTITVKKSGMRDDLALLYVEFSEEVSGIIKEGDFLENPDRTPEVEITGCVFDDFPAIRLSSAQSMRFADNIIKNAKSLCINDLMQFWYVSGCVHNLEITGNRFEQMECAIRIFVERLKESGAMHKNITIADNHFIGCRTGISASCVDGLVLKDNQFSEVEEETKIQNCTGVFKS